MRAFKVIGSFKVEKQKWQDFKIEVAAEDEEGATERTLSNMGSRHRLNRKEIKITEILEIPAGEISDPVVKYMVEEKE